MSSIDQSVLAWSTSIWTLENVSAILSCKNSVRRILMEID